VGCRTLEAPADLAAAVSASERGAEEKPRANTIVSEAPEPQIPAELTQEGWAVSVAQPDSDDVSEFRWQHAGIERLASLPERERPDFSEFLAADDLVVAANAAIMLARSADPTVDRCLVEVARNPQLKMPTRRAAVEALARLDTAVAGPALAELVDEYGDEKSANVYAPELHADLLRGLALHMDPSTCNQFAAALGAPEGEIRQAALYAYTVSNDSALPPEAVEMRADRDPRVRAAALCCLAARRHPQAVEYSLAALSDFHLDVRLAAIAALGQSGGDEARAALQRLLIRDPEPIRSGAVLALAMAGDDVAVFSSAKDPSWQVRRSVARALASFATERGATIARQLLADQSSEVRRAVLWAINGWPLEQAAPILLATMAEAPFQTRKQAAEQLARRWPPATRYPIDAPPDLRSRELADLQNAWQSAQAAAEPADNAAQALAVSSASSQTAVKPQMTAEERQAARPTALAAHHEVLKLDDPLATALAALAMEDVAERRAAAKQMADLAAGSELDEAIVARLVDFGMAETDPLVWRELLRSIKQDSREPAARLASVGMSHSIAEVRRLSCGYLGAHPQRRHAELLVRALDDPNAAVVRAAVEALANPGVLAQPESLERLLTVEDKSLSIAAARALALNGFDSGRADLDRLARDADPEVRRHAVNVMGQLRDEKYVGTLVALLDDDLSVRLAAVASLTQIVGRDVSSEDGQSPPPLADQVQGWKRWWAAERGGRIGQKQADANRG
jgi:HEAT repeat protein